MARKVKARITTIVDDIVKKLRSQYTRGNPIERKNGRNASKPPRKQYFLRTLRSTTSKRGKTVATKLPNFVCKVFY